MNPKDIALLELLIKFSEAIEVEPPVTKDIGQWWAQALNEMKDCWLFDLLENGVFTKNKNKITNKMREMLVEEAEKRQFKNALV